MRRVALAFALVALLATPGNAFVTLRRTTPDDAAVRWSAAHHAAIDGAGLYDGIQVAIEPDFAEKLARAVTGTTDPTDVADISAALAGSFRAWESPVLRFEVTFDGAAERGEQLGSELDVFLVPETDEVFTNNNYFGVTFTDSARVTDRLLTNGVVSPGAAITGSDIFINETILANVAPGLTRPQQLAALQRLMMHEIGHALGFHHPNEFAQSNYDTDSDPLNVMDIDPDDPTAGLQLSPNVNPNSVVSNRPTQLDALFFTSLQHDERGGRDVLYPLHAPACPGDCDEDRTVAVNELVTAVTVALERAEITACTSADRDLDARVRVNELVAAVRNALDGCLADRRIVSVVSVTDLELRLPLAIGRGTIRVEIVPSWEPTADLSLVDIYTAAFAARLRLVKIGPLLSLVATDRNGFEAIVSAPVDGWEPDERHAVTATWTESTVALYIDGVLIDELALRTPLRHPLGATLAVGGPAGTVRLEHLMIFGQP